VTRFVAEASRRLGLGVVLLVVALISAANYSA
jgi:hypothetical protein